MLSVSHLSKSFNYRPVLKDITFNLNASETIVIMGKNGAGKSTLLRILARIMACDSGEVLFQNIDMFKGVPNARKKLLYLGHAPAMYTALSAVENLELAMDLRESSVDQSIIRDHLDKFGLLDQADDPISIYSQGMLQRLKLTYAELADWDLLLIDEPFSGLDQDGILQMDDALTRWKLGFKSMCMVLHNRERAEQYGDRILHLDDGLILEE
ncbi:MAG: ABC transporter ATP-binding protein [Candidatus Marinimicrobia bacterium]|nr:ABC transporter ATP-binding protein [Candidatus Neomarinimicrobiota bacterium]MDP6610864.1 ABC transporter ATP-binding protein [Candidatus Neomarinimicrobiota bacterium]